MATVTIDAMTDEWYTTCAIGAKNGACGPSCEATRGCAEWVFGAIVEAQRFCGPTDLPISLIQPILACSGV